MPLTLLLLLGAIWVPTGSWWRSRIGVDDSVWFSLAALPVALAFLLRVDHGALVDAKSSTMLLAIEGRTSTSTHTALASKACSSRSSPRSRWPHLCVRRCGVACWRRL